jgi:hypothetical protein
MQGNSSAVGSVQALKTGRPVEASCSETGCVGRGGVCATGIFLVSDTIERAIVNGVREKHETGPSLGNEEPGRQYGRVHVTLSLLTHTRGLKTENGRSRAYYTTTSGV